MNPVQQAVQSAGNALNHGGGAAAQAVGSALGSLGPLLNAMVIGGIFVTIAITLYRLLRLTHHGYNDAQGTRQGIAHAQALREGLIALAILLGFLGALHSGLLSSLLAGA